MARYRKLVGTKCYLSPCAPEDAEAWAKWDNDLEVALPLGDEAYTPFSLQKSQEIVASVIRDQDHVFGIVDLETEELIGRCMLFDLDLDQSQGDAGHRDRRKGLLGAGVWPGGHAAAARLWVQPAQPEQRDAGHVCL